jgi:hypothetical protein
MGNWELAGGAEIWNWELERGDSWVGAGLKEGAGSMVMRICMGEIQDM